LKPVDLSHDWRDFRTERLELRAMSSDTMSIEEVDALYALNSDPRVWTHLPSGVHTSREQTEGFVARQTAVWNRDGLGYWIACLLKDGSFAGVGGCTVKAEIAWNVYYRFAPEAQGRGLASELVQAALAAARSARPELPVTALLLEHNRVSKAIAENAGLDPIWRGPDAGNPDPDAIRLVYADRTVNEDTIAKLVSAI
jgi:RimJ/RimL family protein N-acetyltransferase